jgi:peroxiredoxin
MIRSFLLLCAMCTLLACGRDTTTIPTDLPANVGINATLQDDSATLAQVDTPAPDFFWQQADGSTARLSDFRGQRVVVNFWATWCEPCRSEMPDLNAVDGHDVRVVGINKGQQVEVIPAFAQELGVDFQLVSDPDGDVSLAYGARNLPTTIFVGRDGTIAAIHYGILTREALDVQLERIP